MRRAVIAMILSLAVNLAGMCVNYRNYMSEKHLLWSFDLHGGEITVEYGFGLMATHVYAMTPGQEDGHGLRFSALNFAVFLLGISAIAYCLILVAGKAWGMFR